MQRYKEQSSGYQMGRSGQDEIGMAMDENKIFGGEHAVGYTEVEK